MKKSLLTLALVGFCAGAFAQGYVQFNNFNHELTFGSASQILAADASMAGKVVPTDNTAIPSGAKFDGALYGGTSADSLSLIFTDSTSFNNFNLSPNDGLFAASNIGPIAGLPAGTAAFFQVRVYDASFASFDAALAAGKYTGESPVFSLTPGAATAVPSITSGGGTTWANAPIIVSVAAVPEPGTFALAGLGAAAMLIFRRRK